jgi:hypothetical protein
LIVRQVEIEAVEDPSATELLDEVNHLDCVLPAVIAFAARMPAIGILVGGVDSRDHVVARGGGGPVAAGLVAALAGLPVVLALSQGAPLPLAALGRSSADWRSRI